MFIALKEIKRKKEKKSMYLPRIVEILSLAHTVLVWNLIFVLVKYLFGE